MQHDYTRSNSIPKSTKQKYCSWSFLVFLLMIFAGNPIHAEGIQQVAPSADDVVMLLIGESNYGSFAAANGPEYSRLYVQLQNPNESLYLGLSREYDFAGNPQSSGFYSFQIRDASDGSIVHGPYSVNNATENLTNWADAVGPAVLNGGVGYNTDDERFTFSPAEAGLYYVEFIGASYIGYWDFTVGLNESEVPGRVYSKNWAFRTPVENNMQPECVWDREFNGTLYSYTSDGFVSKIDFSDSGFQGLSFSIAFNSNGPGESGDPALDRMSIQGSSNSANGAEHLVFLEAPDPILFPDGECGEVFTAAYFECTGNNAYCLDVMVTIPGQVEVILDFNQNGVYDVSTDRRLVHVFEEGETLTHCLTWDGLMANGTTASSGAMLDLLVSYTQGTQHWALFDGEFLKNGFCVEPIRPQCSESLANNNLFWDDRNITENPGTGQSKDGRNGCDCETVGCRTWNNFTSNNANCSSINDGATAGYGDKNTLNTWWFARMSQSAISNVPLVDVAIAGEASICEGFSTELTLNWTSSAALTSITWTGPSGTIASEANAPNTITVSEAGFYEVMVEDENGCTFSGGHTLVLENCPANLAVDISANNLNPNIGETVDFIITLSNTGPSNANGVAIESLLPAGLINIENISNGGILTGDAINWADLTLAVDGQLTFTFTATITPAFDYTVFAEVIAANQPDTNSTPNNGVDTDADGNCSDDDGDEDDGDCVTLLPQACTISTNVGQVVCSDNGTPSDPSDDTFTFSLTVLNTNGSGTWTSNNASVAEGPYGQGQIFGPFAIADGDLNITISDEFFTNECATTFQVEAPATCSNLCAIEYTVGAINCFDNGTTSFAGDDEFTFEVTITGANTASGWTASNGQNGSYNTSTTIGPFLITDGAMSITFTDGDAPNCTTTIPVTPPPSCSNNCELINTNIQNVICSDNNTPADPSDDTFTFDVFMEGLNTSGTWTTVLGEIGTYGELYQFGPYNIAEGAVEFEIFDGAFAECKTAVYVQPPNTCSNDCNISSEALNILCWDNDTPADPSDDVFTFDLILTALNNTGPTWIQPNGNAGFYGDVYPQGPFPIAGGSVTMNFRDILDANCTSELVINPPATCSEGCELIATVLAVNCNDQNTMLNSFDDAFVYEVQVAGINVSSSWYASDGTSGEFDTPVLSTEHLYVSGSQTITISELDNLCSTTIEVAPPVAEISCPADVVNYDNNANVQVYGGKLDAEDNFFTEIPCFLALHSTPMTIDDRFFEALIIHTPGGDVDTTDYIYSFYLYSNIESTMPIMDNMDGVGGLYYGDYMSYVDPCCYSVSGDPGGLSDGSLENTNPQVDTTGYFDGPMHLVQRFTKSLKMDKQYTLLTSTYGVLSEGDYAWVIVGGPDAPLENLGGDEAVMSAYFDDEEVIFDLTYFDIDQVLDNPESLEILGAAELNLACGLDEFYFEDELNFNEDCETATIDRTFFIETNGVVMDSCEQVISFRRPVYDDIVLPPSVALFNCGEDFPVNNAGFPHPIESGYPIIITIDEPVVLIENETNFNFIASYKDNEIIDTLADFTTINREWSFIDLCSGDTILIFPQTLKIGNFDPPVLECPLSNHYCPIVGDDIMLFDVDPLECTATVEIPMPNIVGDCSEGNAWEIYTEILRLENADADTFLIHSIHPDSSRVLTDLMISDYLIHYQAMDSLGVSLERYCRFRVADLQQPQALCRGGLNISLNGAGLYRIFPNQLDLGSWDNCGEITFDLRRLYTRDPITCDTLMEAYHSDWLPFVDLTCCDAGLIIPIELRVTDQYGNQNVCWLNVEVNDNTLPYCTGLDDISVSCSALPLNFDAYNTEQLAALFGFPTVVDNCAAYAVELTPIVTWNNCEHGTIRRQFRALDQVGNVSAQIFEQLISIHYSNTYAIRFPKDTETNCINNTDTLLIRHPECADLDISHTDVFLPVQGDECYLIERTYHIINQCYYDGFSPATIISRDEDCDAIEGEENVWLSVVANNELAFVDRDSLYLNTMPAAMTKGTACDGTTNEEGYWRTATNVAYWQYTQQIKIYDTEAPQIHFETTAPFCTDENSCEAWVSIPLAITEYCLPENISAFSILLDIGGDGVVDEVLTDEGILVGDWPNYALEGYFPIGAYAFVIGLTDGCNNVGGANIPFAVYDCHIPEIICYSGLIVDLEELLPETDIDGDGDFDDAAVIIEANDLASCEALDLCSDPIRYSVNRIGETPNINNTSIALTCDDRYQIELEVYAWDSAFNPLSIQPDGTIGGPNFDFCTVMVLVQDPNIACQTCLDAELGLEGLIYSIYNEPINNVTVDLFQNEEFSQEKGTNLVGQYNFFGLEFAQDYEVKPYKNDDVTNGITTIDLILLQQHYLGNILFSEPTLLIAGDVNRSGAITTLDILHLQQVLLGNFTAFPNNTSWRFFPSYFSPTAENVWTMPSSIMYSDLLTCQFDQHFTGIKIGDFNGSVNEGGFASDEVDSRNDWPIQMSNNELPAGSIQRVAVKAKDLALMSGMQFGLAFDLNAINIVEIEGGLIQRDQISTTRLTEGLLTALWMNTKADISEDAVLFTLVVQTKEQSSTTAEVFRLSDRVLKPEIYDQSYTTYNASLEFIAQAPNVVLLSNRPDPFEVQTNIEFYLPNEGKAQLKIQDVNGRTLSLIEKHFSAGTQTIQVDGANLPAGVLTYTLTFDGQQLTRRMVKI